jgi:hypothetical protein
MIVLNIDIIKLCVLQLYYHLEMRKYVLNITGKVIVPPNKRVVNKGRNSNDRREKSI